MQIEKQRRRKIWKKINANANADVTEKMSF